MVLLRQYLEATDWEVARAHALWNRHRERILAGEDPDQDDDDNDDSSSLSSLSSASTRPHNATSNNRDSADTSLNNKISTEVELMTTMEGEHLPFNVNIEQERRDLALAFRVGIEEKHGVLLSISEAVLLLHLADWDISLALAQFQSHEQARNRLRVAFDSLRIPTGDVNEQSARIAAMLDICERADWFSIKLFLQKKQWDLVRSVIAWYREGIPAFTSADIRGIAEGRPHWGLRVDHNGRVRDAPTAEECRAVPDADVDGWNDDGRNFTNPNDLNPPAPYVYGQCRGRRYDNANERRPGFALRAGPNSFIRLAAMGNQEKAQTVQPGPANPSKFILEYVSKGQYRFNLFKHKKYFFSDRVEDVEDDSADLDGADGADGDEDYEITSTHNVAPSGNTSTSSPSTSSSPTPSPKRGKVTGKRGRKTTGKSSAEPKKRPNITKPVVEFNFETPSHLADLNNWRRQIGSRVEGRVLRRPAQKWSPEELDFLYQLSEEWIAALKEKYPTKTRKALLETGAVSKATKQEWAHRMNERFSGTFPADDEGKKPKAPRFDREPMALMTMRHRHPKLFVHFRVSPDKKWLAKVDAAEIEQLEDERDAMERLDYLLTAVARAAAEDSGEREESGEEGGEPDDDENEDKGDVLENGDEQE
jgi:hypothetical protein